MMARGELLVLFGNNSGLVQLVLEELDVLLKLLVLHVDIWNLPQLVVLDLPLLAELIPLLLEHLKRSVHLVLDHEVTYKVVDDFLAVDGFALNKRLLLLLLYEQ